MLECYDDILSISEACKAMKIGKGSLYTLLQSQQLKGYRNGRVWRIPKEAIEEYVCSSANLIRK